jgi:hypothetical protein
MRSARLARWGAALATTGGSAAAYGSVLTWARVTGRRATVDVNGADLFANLTVTCGLLAVIAGLLLLSASGGRLRTVLAAVTLAAGLTAAGLTVYVATSDQAVLTRLAEQTEESGQGGGRLRGLGSLEGRRAPDVAPAFGVYLVAAGGVLAAAGGVAGLIGGRSAASTTPEED